MCMMTVLSASFANLPKLFTTPMQITQCRLLKLPDFCAGTSSSLRATGKPVELLVKAEPHMPDVASLSLADFQFRPAERRIMNQADLQRFLKSKALKDFMAFILALNDAAHGQPISAPVQQSKAVGSILQALDTLNGWVDEIPPLKQALRYGNPAFRTWFNKIDDNAHDLLRSVLPSHLAAAAVELKPILVDSFGNKTRIDYGTGHETTFCELLFCLAKLGVFQEQDRLSLVTHVFSKYLQLMRKVQTTYW